MSDYLLLVTIGIMVFSIFTDIFRCYQFKKYIAQNKLILSEMESKRKQIFELSILFEKIGDINDTINDTNT